MSYIMVDVESDGPVPSTFSMVRFGAVVVEPSLSRTFYGETRPISEEFMPEALAVTGIPREQHLLFEDPKPVMERFDAWLRENSVGRPRFISDNNGYDWQFINYYFWTYLRTNPFGHSSSNLNSIYKGLIRDDFRNFKSLRKTKHTHHPLDDAMGNAEALLYMNQMMGYRVNLV